MRAFVAVGVALLAAAACVMVWRWLPAMSGALALIGLYHAARGMAPEASHSRTLALHFSIFSVSLSAMAVVIAACGYVLMHE